MHLSSPKYLVIAFSLPGRAIWEPDLVEPLEIWLVNGLRALQEIWKWRETSQ
jgi:hypothetical protein